MYWAMCGERGKETPERACFCDGEVGRHKKTATNLSLAELARSVLSAKPD